MRDLTHLIAFLITINFILGLVGGVYYEYNNTTTETLNNELESQETEYQSLITNEWEVDKSIEQSDIASSVDTWNSGTKIWDILKKGITLPFKNLEVNTDFEDIVMKIIIWFMRLIYIGIISVMAIKVFLAKRTDLGG